tara:strand:- start:327 stop:815 length:489 start_codon:yes stop_codon:yes gene_type:complete
MPIVLNGSTNVISGVAVGGLPDGIVDTDMLAANAVATAKIADDAVTDAKENLSGSLKAWINYDGYGNSIRASYNISSVTDNGTGDYTFFIDTDFSDVNYCWTGTATTATGTETTLRNIGFSTASSSTSDNAHLVGSTRVSVATQNSAANLHDARQVMVQWVR